MPELTLAYRCSDRKLPLYIKHSEVEGIAVLARLECAGMKPGDKCTVSMQVLSGHEIRKQLRLKPLEDGYIDP